MYKFYQNSCNETATDANFHFCHYKSMENLSCHDSKQSSYLIGTKHYSFPQPIDAIGEIW